MSAPRPARRAFTVVAVAALVGGLLGLAPPGVSAQDEAATFNASLPGDWVSGSGFAGDVTVTVTDPRATPPATETYGSAAVQYDDQGGFTLFMDPSEQPNPWDIQPGNVITVAGPAATKTLVVSDLRITGFDLAANTLWGTSDGATAVDVRVSRPGGETWVSVPVNAGAWAADFDDAEPPYDLRVMDGVRTWQADGDGDTTEADLDPVAPARFGFEREYQEVIGAGWPEGAAVTLTIDRAPFGSVDFSATTTADPNLVPETFMPGNVYVDLAGGAFRAQPGDVLEMTDGSTTKTLEIPDLVVDLQHADTITGTTTMPMPADSFLVVGLDGGDRNVEVAPEPGGSWSARFEGGVGPIGETEPRAVQTDVDGDCTWVNGPIPRAAIDPASDRVWAADFAAGSVTLTVARGGAAVHSATVATRNVLFGWNPRLIDDMWVRPTGSLARPTMALFDLRGTFDIQGGDGVTVSDGVTNRTSVVDFITVDTANPLTDIVAGRADAPVTFKMGDGTSGYWGYPTTFDAGRWSTWLEPGVFPNPPEGLRAGDHGWVLGDGFWTMVRWSAAADPVFHGFFQPVDNRPTVNQMKAGRAVEVRFSLGGDYGLDIFAAGSPSSQRISVKKPRLDAVEGTTAARTSGLRYDAKTAQYVYTWKTDKTWAGTFRQLVLTLANGQAFRADFMLVK